MIKFLLISVLLAQIVLCLSREARLTTTLSGRGTFQQYIDHNDLDKGTFPQSFWFNATYWEGPGSPIVFYTPGQNAATDRLQYLTDTTLPGLVAKTLGGAVVLVEHRYFGDSFPFSNLTTENMQYLTLEQVVADFVHFARTVDLPFDASMQSRPSQVPWVWIGNSYSAALAAWAEKLVPGTFWAYYASGAMTNVINDFWQFNYPTQQGMPSECRSSFEAIIAHVDSVFQSGSREEQEEIKKQFGLQDLTRLDDAANALSQPIIAWTFVQPSDDHTSFYDMCNAIKGTSLREAISPEIDQGARLKRALDNYATWFTTYFLPGRCDSYGYSDWAGRSNVQCFGTLNPQWEAFRDLSPKNTLDRSWNWMTCTYFRLWITGAPESQPTVYSRLVNTTYMERQCDILFPPQDRSGGAEVALKMTDAAMNALTGGWDHQGTRILFTNGEFDPWRSASVSSIFRPGGPMQGTSEQPIILIKGVQHCADMLARNLIDEPVQKAIAAGIEIISKWVAEFSTQKQQEAVFQRLPRINCIH
ncbi:endoprotease [Colletotrichum falcatum]|nr:endoprotease [Colletotrichum falcatum]